jgi:flagellar basal-body rod protein FlgF
MDALIYTVMSGADRTLRAQQIHANNLANAETTGFRADIEVASAQAVPGYGYEARHMAQLQASAVDARAGTVTPTGRSLDVALKGEGYLAVEYAGGEAYTRSGNLNVDSQGALTINGRAVLGDGGAITLPAFAQVSISDDGTISVLPQGETGALQEAGKLKLVRPNASELTKNEAGLVVSRSGQPLPVDDSVQVLGGHLERSNVSAVEEMIATMTLTRSFEVQMKMFKSADDMADAGNRLIRA